MTDELYTDTPPTEAGWYWLRSERGREHIARRTRDGEWEIDGPDLWEEWGVSDNYQFGPRIPSPQELAELRRKQHAAQAVFHEVEQVLGKALGYPPAFPDVSEVDDGSVAVGDHVPETLAAEAARVIGELRRDAERFRTCERLAEYWTNDGGFWAVRANSGDTFTEAVDAAKETP